MIGRVERIWLSPRAEASRTLTWEREALGRRDARLLARLTFAGSVNVGAAVVDRWRRPHWWCPCCDRVTGNFLTVGNRLRLSRHAVCPGCGSRSRHRGIALAIDRLTQGRAVRDILQFAPEASLSAVLHRQHPDARLVTTDRHRTDVDRPGEDIQALTFPDGGFDLVVCNHVLEHVPDDRAAAAELARVTAPDGLVVVSVPGDWSRRGTVTFADQTFNGHHRDYGTEVVDLLRSVFATVDVIVLGDLQVTADRPDPGLRPDDRLFICHPA